MAAAFQSGVWDADQVFLALLSFIEGQVLNFGAELIAAKWVKAGEIAIVISNTTTTTLCSSSVFILGISSIKCDVEKQGLGAQIPDCKTQLVHVFKSIYYWSHDDLHFLFR